MTIISVTYHVKPGCREKFTAALLSEGIPEKTAKEPGNLGYCFSVPLEGENEVCLLEKWESAASLAPHRTQPHYLRLQELKAEYVVSTEILRAETKEK